MAKQLMLNSRYVMNKTDFTGQFLNLKEEQGNSFTSQGKTKVNIIAIFAKWSIHVCTACPNKFLEQSPATCDMAEGGEFMVGLGTSSNMW
jgi:hypothetical protein